MARISQSQLAKFFRRLATSYTAGIDLRSILKRETEVGSSSYRQESKKLAEGVSRGMSLSEAMSATDGYFPPLAVSVVHAGEKGGRLEESFSRLADHYGNLVAFRNRLLGALAWPIFEMSIAILMVGVMMAICDWIFRQLDRPPYNWLGMGSTMGNVIAYFIIVGMVLGGLFFLFRGVVLGWFGDVPMRIAHRIPVLGRTMEYLALARFAWTMSIAENAGMNPVEIAQLSLRATENHFYNQHEQDVCLSLEAGKPFYQTLKATTAFPEDLLIYIDNGETAGELAESMERASVEYQARADLNLKLLGTIGFVITFCIVALMVLGVVVFAMQQYLNILSGI